MKNIIKNVAFCVATLILLSFVACGEREQSGANKALALHNDFLSYMIDKANASEEVIALEQRAKANNYALMSAPSLENLLQDNKDSLILIATLPRGIYNLGLIEGARHFEFAKSITFNDDGSEWNWEKDALGRAQSEFLAFLGEDKNKTVVFYDEGEDVFAPFGSAHTAIIWAKHLGYKNVYRLVGGFGAWKGLGLPLTTQTPQCCENADFHTQDSRADENLHDGHHSEHNHEKHHEAQHLHEKDSDSHAEHKH